jgi:HD-like signal output (HDOD) protein
MPASNATPTLQRVGAELDAARRSGPLQRLVVPPSPDRLVQLRAAVTAPEPDLAAVARIAASDVAMAATLLAAANSAEWAHAQPARTVGQALDRLGLDETAQRMTAFIARTALRVNHPQLQGFWEQSGERARVMAYLARQLPGMSADVAYTFGLFCHVGMPVLMQCVRGYGATLVEAGARRDRSFVATENANHRTDHAETGALVARVWQLAPQAMVAIRLHHQLEGLDDDGLEPDLRTLLAAGLVADHLVRRAAGLDPERDWLDHGARALRWLQVDANDLDQWSWQLDETTANP